MTYSKAFLTMERLSAKLPVMKRLKIKSNGFDHVQSFSKSSILCLLASTQDTGRWNSKFTSKTQFGGTLGSC